MATRLVRFTGSSLAVLALGGCISRVHAPYLGPPDPRPTEARHASAEHQRAERESVRVEPAGEKEKAAGAHRALKLVVPSVGDNGQENDAVRATYHESTAPGRQRLVIVLPIWGASTYPPRQVVSRLLSRRGDPTHVLEVHGERKLFDWASVGAAANEAELLSRLGATTASLSHSAEDVRRLLDWVERRGGVDPGRIGIVGLSVGALVGALAMGLDDRFAAGAFVMGGARLHEVLGACRGRAGDARRRLLRRFGWDAATFRRKIEATVRPHDPERVAGRVHPSRVLLVDAAFDHCMPQTARDGLWEALGRPERITLRYGHKLAFLSMTPLGFHYTTRRILAFLDDRLRAPVPAAAAPGAVAASGGWQ